VHHSILDWQGQSYLFYHDRDLSPSFDKNRSIRADKLFFNADGSIQKVKPTLRGIGVVNASSEIHIDRYSAKSAEGIAVSFINEANPHAGWKTTFGSAKSWIRFNEVDFGRGAKKSINLRAKASASSTLEIHLDNQDGPLLGRVKIDESTDWKISSATAKKIPKGVHDIVITQAGGDALEVDWLRFR
jgi:hypothetical protein